MDNNNSYLKYRELENLKLIQNMFFESIEQKIKRRLSRAFIIADAIKNIRSK